MFQIRSDIYRRIQSIYSLNVDEYMLAVIKMHGLGHRQTAFPRRCQFVQSAKRKPNGMEI